MQAERAHQFGWQGDDGGGEYRSPRRIAVDPDPGVGAPNEFASLESDEVAVEQGALNKRQISGAGVFVFCHPGKVSRQLESGGI